MILLLYSFREKWFKTLKKKNVKAVTTFQFKDGVLNSALKPFGESLLDENVKRNQKVIHSVIHINVPALLHSYWKEKEKPIAFVSGTSEGNPTSCKITSITGNHLLLNLSALLCEK